MMFQTRIAYACAALFVSTCASAQDAETYRKLCTDDGFRKEFEAEIADYDREIFAWELKDRCPRLDLSDKPVNDSADTSRDNSHTDWVYDANYSPDGKLIVSAGRDQTVRIWDAETGKSLRKIVLANPQPAAKEPKINYVRYALFLPDGKRIAAGSDDKPTELFDASSGEKAGEIEFPHTNAQHSFPPHIATNASGLVFLAADNDALLAYDPSSQSVKYSVKGHAPEAAGVAVSDAAKLGASTSESKTVQLWRLESGELVKSAALPGREVPGNLAFSRDGKMLAVAAGGSVHIYAVPDLKLVRTIVSHPMFSVFDTAFTADGKGLLVCRSHLVLWDIASGNIVRHYGPFNDLCHSVDVSPDGRHAVTTSMTSDLKVWDIASGTFDRRLGIDVKPPR